MESFIIIQYSDLFHKQKERNQIYCKQIESFATLKLNIFCLYVHFYCTEIQIHCDEFLTANLQTVHYYNTMLKCLLSFWIFSQKTHPSAVSFFKVYFTIHLLLYSSFHTQPLIYVNIQKNSDWISQEILHEVILGEAFEDIKQ